MSGRCADVLSPSQAVRSLRIVESVDGFHLQRFDGRGSLMGDLQFETMDEAMRHVYDEFDGVSEWRMCPDVVTDGSARRRPGR